MTPQLIADLKAFRDKDKFSSATWVQRGLIPSSHETVIGMNHVVNTTIDEIIASRQDLTEDKIRSIVQMHLAEGRELDTEEREFLAETFYSLSKILKVEIKDVLNKFMYSF